MSTKIVKYLENKKCETICFKVLHLLTHIIHATTPTKFGKKEAKSQVRT